MINTIDKIPGLRDVLDDCQNKAQELIGKPIKLYFKFTVHSITSEMIIRELCEHYQLTWSVIISNAEHPNIVAKQLYAWLARTYTSKTNKELARIMGCATHTAVTRACDRVKHMIETKDDLYVLPLNAVEAKLLAS